MKRHFGIFFILLIFLTACSVNVQSRGSAEDVKIDDVKLTQFERGIMNLVGESATILELHVQNEEANEIELTVYHYENGELKDTDMYFTSSLNDIDFSNPIQIVAANRVINNKQQWVGSVITKESVTTIQTDLEPIPDYSSKMFNSVSTPLSVSLGEKKIIATSILIEEDSLDLISNLETEENLAENSKYDHVYVYYLQVK